MIQVKNLSIIFCLMATTASASVIIEGLETLSVQDQEKVFSILLKPKHNLEKADEINADLALELPTKNLNAYWVPDTLYQVTQSYFDVEGLTDHGDTYAKQAQFNPDYWKKAKKMGDKLKTAAVKPHWFNEYKYPTNLEEHKALSPSVVTHWARFNRVAHRQLELANFRTQGADHALSRIFVTGPQFQETYEKRRGGLSYSYASSCEHTSHLKKNEVFLKHALRVEEQAHNEGKLLLWRYAQPLPGEIPDLPFKIHANGLQETLNSPLEYHELTRPRFSYAARLLEGFYGDGTIYEMPYNRFAAPACTFSFLANDVAAKEKGHNIPDSIVYSLALSPEKIKELNDKFYLHYPREAMPQHTGIYGTGEAFHPSWLLRYKNKENVKAWLDLMQSDALQVHLTKGTLQADYKNNQEVNRLKNIYNQFLNKANAEPIALPVKPAPVQPVPVHPKPTTPAAPVKPVLQSKKAAAAAKKASVAQAKKSAAAAKKAASAAKKAAAAQAKKAARAAKKTRAPRVKRAPVVRGKKKRR